MKMIIPVTILLSLGACFSDANDLRTAKQLGIFSLLRFPNDACEGTSQRTGTCLTRPQCRFRGGLVVGLCAQGFAVCCEITRSCNSEIRDNGTFFVNPNYPSIVHTTQSCRLSVRKQNQNICQLRLDFDQFQTRGPKPDTGKCDADYFLVSGQDVNSVVPSICGDNDKQHIYVDVGSSNGPISLLMVTSGNGEGLVVPRTWKIRVTQIACNSPWRAPSGCLQYYSTGSDRVKSFNYGNLKANQSGYPSGLYYTVCLRKEMGLCSASFKSEGVFGVGDSDTSGPATDQTCTKDYLVIGEKRYCGGTGLPDQQSPQTQGTGPLAVTFVSETTRATGTVPYSGFNIMYSQNRCSPLAFL